MCLFCLRCCVLLVVFAISLGAQSPQPDAGEVNSQEIPITFRVRVDQVTVPVVVRDAQGRCVGNLGRDDFELFDRGKPQPISSFAVERRDRRAAESRPAPTPLEVEAGERSAVAAPGRYVAYLFDDFNPDLADLMRARLAARRHMKGSLQPTDRAAILTSSGRVSLDFTDDLVRIESTLLQIQRKASSKAECPDFNRLMADRLQFLTDPVQNSLVDVLALAIYQLSACGEPADEAYVQSKAHQVISETGMEVQTWFRAVRAMIARMAVLPGQRLIVLASPGFNMLPEDYSTLTEVLSLAVRSRVIINALDVRGVYGPPSIPTADKKGHAAPEVTSLQIRYANEAAFARSDVLAALAEGTGGRLVAGTNDLDEGFSRLVALPEFVYMLGFKQGDSKSEGQMHPLKVRLLNGKGLTVQARRGYYAAKPPSDPGAAAKQEIEDAVFSRSEIRDLPCKLQTQFFKTGEHSAKVTVMARIALRTLQLRKDQGRNRNDVTIIAALFDRNGTLVASSQKKVELRLRDETLDLRRQSTITVQSSFDIAPGSYAVRLVARDAEEQRMTAENGSVEVP